MSVTTFVLVVVVCGLVPAVAWFYGYNFGVRDTERRWSNAVNRADAWRAEQAERASPANGRKAP